MKRYPIIVIFALISVSAFCLPSIAILDAILADGVDITAKVPVTEKIIEEIVTSGKYTVLDRSSIQQVLEEKKFQLSGVVADNEIKKAGEYLGADIVCVAKVSRIGETYFISGKMINVETGAITAQKSHEQKGDIEVVLAIAQVVGKALAGGVLEESADKDATAESEPGKPEESAETTQPAPKSEPETADILAPRSHAVGSYLIPFNFGGAIDEIDELIDYSISLSGSTLGDYDFESKTVGVGAHFMQTIGQWFYGAFSVAYTRRSDNSYYFTDPDEYYINFSTFNARLGAGALYRSSELLQYYAGVGIGYFVMIMDEDLWGTDFFTYAMEDSDWSYYGEVGVDLLLSDTLVINAGLTFVGATLNEDTIFYDQELAASFALSIGAGIAY
ncbi:MAG: hypothetical protein HN368_07575 [Spirochaetales bacterium]|nr:hypothetical protein [Spirochaetales bacterium]